MGFLVAQARCLPIHPILSPAPQGRASCVASMWSSPLDLVAALCTVVAAVHGELSAQNKMQGSRLDTGCSSKGHSLGSGICHTHCMPAGTVTTAACRPHRTGWLVMLANSFPFAVACEHRRSALESA